MPEKNKKLVISQKLIISLFMGFVGVAVAFALVQAPPKVVEEHNCEDEQPQVMRGTLQDIDLSKAKIVRLQPKELENEDCANAIANSLNKLNAIGELTVDLTKKL